MKAGLPLICATLSLFLVGCGTIGTYQEDCEKKYPRFQDMVKCLKAQTSQDIRYTHGPDADLAKVYLLQADKMSTQLEQGQLNENDARLALATDYSQLKGVSLARRSQIQRDNAISLSALSNYMQATQPQPVYVPQRPALTSCRNVGGTIQCMQY